MKFFLRLFDYITYLCQHQTRKVMKRLLAFLAVAMLTSGMVSAQTKDTKKKEKTSIGQSVSNFFKKVKNEVEYTADGLFSKNDNDLSLIDGNYYMQVYDTNLYKGTDGESMRQACLSQFAAKYPTARVLTCTLPQEKWSSSPVKKNDAVVGYVQTMYCYVLAKDGTDGYINAKYTFLRTKDVGKAAVKDKSNWGRCMRTDVLSNDVYAELTKEKDKKR